MSSSTAEPQPQRDSPAVIRERQHVLLDAFDETHAYIGDGIRDHRGEDRCATCHLPLVNPVHKPSVEMVGIHKNYWFREIHPNAFDALNKLYDQGWLRDEWGMCPSPCGRRFHTGNAVRCRDCVGRCPHLPLPGYIAKSDGRYAPRQYCGRCGTRQQPDAPKNKVIYNICFKDPRDQYPPEPCERCGATTGTQLHHWAPVAIFEDAWDWPMSWLCPKCHQLWHKAMREAEGYRLAEGRRAALPTAQLINGGGRV